MNILRESQMKKLSSRDKAIIIIISFLGFLLGWAACHIWESRKAPVTVENPANDGLKKKADSLEAVVISRDSRIAELEQEIIYSDSVVVKNHKSLKGHYNEYKTLPDSVKHHYIDSILKVAGKR